MNWTAELIPDQSGRLAIVTGANTGIGFETAKALAGKGAEVILACRNQAKGQQALDLILHENPNASVALEELNLSSLVSVRRFAETIRRDHNKLDLLINNAGVMVPPYQLTEDGFELQFGTNHLGHFALTGLLMDLLHNTPNSRVVSLSSVAHRFGKIDFANLNAEKGYNKLKAYGQSKLACLMFAYELHRRLETGKSPAISVAAHPGATITDLGRHSWFLDKVMRFAQTVPEGARPSLRAATAPDVKGGEFYGPCGFLHVRGFPEREKSNKRSMNAEVGARLFDISEELTGVRFPKF